MTSQSNTVQEKITVMQMPYRDVCTLFPRSLCYHKLRQRSYATLKTVMANCNFLSDTYNLQDGTLPKDTPSAEKILQQEGHYFLSDNIILYRQSHTRKRAVIQLVMPKTLQMELLHWCHDHFTSGDLGLNKTCERLKSTCFWNNVFADLQQWIKSCVSCA